MKVKQLELRGTHPHSFRRGEWAKVVSAVWVTPEGQLPRLALVCVYSDGVVDYIAAQDHENFEIRPVQS